jgi:hypothetical protein
MESLEERRVLAAVGVTTLADVVDSTNMTSIAALQNNPGSDGKISLREAITAANADATADSITFDPSISGMNGGQILLSLTLGQLNITNALTIDASGLSAGIIINGNDPTPGRTGQGIRLFDITDPSGGTAPPLVTLVGLTLKGSDVSGDGGAIRSLARLIIRDCVIEENEAIRGGGIFVEVAGGGTPREILRIENSIIDSNDASSGGGLAIFSGSQGSPTQDTAVITGSTFRYHEIGSSGGGGAIDATLYGAALTIDAGSFLLNEAQDGGAIRATLSEGAELNIVDSNFEENDASGNGGGVQTDVTDSTVQISGTTFHDNLASQSGGGAWLDLYGSSTAEIVSSIITENKSLQHGGGVFLRTDQSQHLGAGPHTVLTVHNSLFEENEANQGGGLALALGGAAIDGNHFQAVGQRAAISRSTFSANKAVNNGGGIRTWQGAGAEVEVTESTVTGNTAGVLLSNGLPFGALADAGGGIYSYLFSGDDPINGGDPNETDNGIAKLVITGSTIDGNQAGSFGGGIAICAKRQDFELAIRSRLAVVNSTISGNSVLRDDPSDYVGSEGKGGGVAIAIYPNDTNEGMDSHFENATVTKNRAEIGGGIWSMVSGLADGRTNTWLTNTIIAGNARLDNSTGSNFYGSIVHPLTQYNLFGPAPTNTLFSYLNHAAITFSQLGAGNLQATNNDPKLSDLALNGGPTRTHALLSDSPAIDAGLNSLAVVPFDTTSLTTDQRGAGFPRSYDVAGVTVSGAGPVDIGAYEASQPAIMCDYNRDGVVDEGDYEFWRSTFDNLIYPHDGADGSGNGVIDAADYVIWADCFDDMNGFAIGDYNENGVVDIADFNLWRNTFGNAVTAGTGADGNGNGVIDAADYVIWRDTFGSMVGAAKFGMLDAAFGPGLPPEVVGFALETGSGGIYDFTAAAGTGEQLRSIPLSAANALSITFNQAVTVSSGALTLINLDGTSPTVSSFAYDSDSQTATWTFASSLADGRYLVRLADSIQNGASEALDGEFTNPWSLSQTDTSVFASGDQTAGGEFRFRFTVLAGDTDHDNIDGSTNYTNWKSYEPGMIHVSTTTDEFDSDLSFGDVSLREAVDYANNATEPTTIDLPTGRYTLTLSNTEGSGTAENDLDVTGNVTIIGAGPGLSVITNNFTYAAYQEHRNFQVAGATARLKVFGITFAGGFSYASNAGIAALVQDGATLEMDSCVVVNNIAAYYGVGVRSMGGNLSIMRSVFTGNVDYSDGAVYASDTSSYAGSLNIDETIFALNTAQYSAPNVRATTAVVKTNLGNNRYDSAAGGFFDVVSGTGDYLGAANYVITTVADTFDHTNNAESLSIREAIDLANTASGAQEVWIPAWHFTLTRDRGSATTDTDVSFGDLDISGNTIVRGVSGATSVGWKAGVVDRVFDLLGDYNRNGVVDSADYALWANQNGLTGSPEQFAADGDDDGDVDSNDYNVWYSRYGNTFAMYGVTELN